MKKFALALAGASVAISGLAASPAAADDFSRHDRGQYQQVEGRNFGQNRGFDNNRYMNHGRYMNNGRYMNSDRYVRGERYNNEFQDRRWNRGERYNNEFQDRRWNRGERFDHRYASNYMVISDPAYYSLRPAPYGYRWVRSGNDAVLVAIASGIIGALVANAF